MAPNLLQMQDVAPNSKCRIVDPIQMSGGLKDGVRRDEDAGLANIGSGGTRDAEPPRVAGAIRP